MLRRLTRSVALGALLATPVLAADAPSQPNTTPPPGPSRDFTLESTRPQPMPGVAPGRRPLMELLDMAGAAKPLEDLGLNIYGHAEASYTWNFDDPDDDLNPFRVFDFEHDDPTFNQLGLVVERAVDYRKNEWNLGFRMEWLYGADASLIHANGLFDYYDGVRDPENQWDLFQLYADLTVPVGTGLRVRVGKFANLVGYETVDPTTGGIVDFYSRSLIFFNYPYTHTGVLFTYDITKDVTLTAGISRGDNQATEDNNDSISFLGSVNWVINDQWALYVSNSTGPEQDENDSDLRTTWDATLYYSPTKDTTAALNFYFIHDSDAAADGDDAHLFAVALLGAHRLNDMFTLKARAEYLTDPDDYRFGEVDDIYEVTLGLTIRPFPNDKWGRNLKIRPEVRWDYSPDGPFDGGDDHQFTAAIDVVVTF